MQDVFVTPPGWSWDIVLYFFFGGLAGGAYFIASMLRLVGKPADRRLSRIGQYLAFPLILACAILLIKDLGRPERFWHMVFQSERFPAPMFKWWSPISFGTWVVTLFGVFTVLSFIHALAEGGILRVPGLSKLVRTLHTGGGALSAAFLILGAVWGLLLAGYTGTLLMVSNAPTWSHDPLLPPLFMASGVATAGAALYLIARHTGAGDVDGRHRALRTSVMALALETLLLVVAALLGLRGVSPFFLGGWAVLFWLVILPLGVVLPLALLFMAEFRGRELVRNAPVVGAVLLLVGGLLLRVLEVIGGQAYYVPY